MLQLPLIFIAPSAAAEPGLRPVLFRLIPDGILGTAAACFALRSRPRPAQPQAIHLQDYSQPHSAFPS